LKQWKNAAEQSNPFISTSLPIYTFLLVKNLFFRGLKQNFSYLCKKIITMNTISVKIEQPNHAAMLVEWLKNIRFVKEVDVKVDAPAKKGNAGEIMKMIDSMKGNPYADIKDPVAYQRQLRDEWER